MSNNKFMSVPQHNGTAQSMGQAIDALKHNFEVLAGQRQSQPGSLGAGDNYFQAKAPAQGSLGDTWINSTTNQQFHWNGKTWTPTV